MGIRLGLVGLGSFGSAFAPLFSAHPLVDGVVLCDAEASKLEKWTQTEGIRKKLLPGGACLSFDEICARQDLDALVIITQPWLHAPQCIQAMESGKHVYSAVPVTCLPDDSEILDWCGKIIDCSLRTGQHYMLGETTIYRPQTMFCRKKAALGEFGNFVFAEAEYAHDVDCATCSLREVLKSRTTGVIGAQREQLMRKYYSRGLKHSPMDYPTHSVSGPVSVMKSRPLDCTACGYRNANQDEHFRHFDFSNVVAFYRMDNGASLRIAEMREISPNVGCMGEDFRIFGTRGSYSYQKWCDNGRNVPDGKPKENCCTELTESEMRDPLPKEVADAFKKALGQTGSDFVPAGHGGSHPYLVHEFVSAVSENRTPEISAWDAALYMAMGVAAHQSALKDGEKVKVFDFGRKP